MRSVTVRLNAAEFSAAMTTIGEWLDTNRYEPTRYKYDHHEDAVLVTVDFTTEQRRLRSRCALTVPITHLPNPRRRTACASCRHRLGRSSLRPRRSNAAGPPVASGPRTPTVVTAGG